MKKYYYSLLTVILFSVFSLVAPVSSADNTISPKNRPSSDEEAPEPEKQYVRIRGGLKKMMELSDTQKEMQEELDAETECYKKILKGFEKGHLKKGMYTSSIAGEYGEPVVINKEFEGDKEWVYKSGYDSYFSDKEVSLIFGPDDKLKSWRGPKTPDKK